MQTWVPALGASLPTHCEGGAPRLVARRFRVVKTPLPQKWLLPPGGEREASKSSSDSPTTNNNNSLTK